MERNRTLVEIRITVANKYEISMKSCAKDLLSIGNLHGVTINQYKTSAAVWRWRITYDDRTLVVGQKRPGL